MKQFLRSALSFAGSFYYRIRAVPWVWESLLNRKARRLWRAYPAALTTAEAAALGSLNKTGIAVVHISDFFPAGIFAELRSYAQRRWASSEVQAAVEARRRLFIAGKPKLRKSFLVDLWAGSSGTAAGHPLLELTHPFLRFSLSQPILTVVNAYLGMFSKFRLWHLEATLPLPPNIPASNSQRWHRDYEDRKLVKVFLYLNDVDESAGPFTYLKRSHAGGAWRGLFPMRPPRGTLAMPSNVDELVPPADVVRCTGQAGTLIFCDTSGLHKGGLAISGHRLMHTASYTSSASLWPIRYAYPPEFKPPADLSPAARFAIENDPRQREPRFYL